MAKNKEKLLHIMQLRAMGKSMEEISKEVGVTRQTVSSYLRTPEAQAIADELQSSLLSTLQNALSCVNSAIEKGDVQTARTIAVNLGKIALSQTPRGTGEQTKLSPEERAKKLESLKKELLGPNKEV